jgi:hypothetical protein
MVSCSSSMESCPPSFLPVWTIVLVAMALGAILVGRRAYRIVGANIRAGHVKSPGREPTMGIIFVLGFAPWAFPICYLDSAKFLRTVYDFGPIGVSFFILVGALFAVISTIAVDGPIELQVAGWLFFLLGFPIVGSGTYAIRRAIKNNGGLNALPK